MEKGIRSVIPNIEVAKVLNVTPIGKPTMTQNCFWKKNVQRYFAYRDAINEQLGGFKISGQLIAEYHIPIPKSLSKKEKIKRLEQGLHDKKPDSDNITKGLKDTNIVDGDDCTIHSDFCRKLWTSDPVGKIVIYKLIK